MQKLVSSKQIRDFESQLIQKIGNNWSLALMEKAGSGLADVAKEYSEPYLIICGKGNNGGDGFVAARYLYNLGKKVFIFLISEESSLSPDAKVNFDIIKNKVPYLKIENEKDNNFYNALNNASTVLDCLLGTGTDNKLSPFFEWLIKTINSSGKAVIACDVPTGIDPDTGKVPVRAIKARVTVTFGYPKLGLVVYPAKKFVGIIKTVDIGLPDIATNLFLLDDQFLKENFPKRPEDANKGTFGRTLLVCGSKKYPGAALLSGKAAASIGSGLTSLASPSEVFTRIAPVTPEITHVDFTLNTILEESLNSSVLVIGPGLSTSEEIVNIVEGLIVKASVPIVLDADGINVLADKREIIKKSKKHVVLTPHPKEFARFLGLSVDDVLNDKVSLAKSTAMELGCTVVLKGPGTIIATKDEKIYISPFGNAALAKGGTGDVLAGFIGGLVAQGLESDIAACIGVYIHGKTAELVTKDKTVFSLLPQDLISYLPYAIKAYI
ncbi:MAG: NAD(P)H-hydrate dehydratase [Candidatus Melainabacteria bacterium]|nr:NAD(P)H-hydrate dehydratase [Candidatus Melainabacteria bacterium]